jgi:hypothetical protein
MDGTCTTCSAARLLMSGPYQGAIQCFVDRQYVRPMSNCRFWIASSDDLDVYQRAEQAVEQAQSGVMPMANVTGSTHLQVNRCVESQFETDAG